MPAGQPVSYRHLGDAPGAFDFIAFANGLGIAEQRSADVVLLEIQHYPVDLVRKLQQLAGRGVLEPVDFRDAVAA